MSRLSESSQPSVVSVGLDTPELPGEVLDFETYRRRANVDGIRFGTLQPLILIPPFILTDIFLIPKKHFAVIQVLRCICLAFAGTVRWATTHKRSWVERHGDILFFSMMWTVGVFVSALCWAHTGYESPYCLGLVFIFTGTVLAMTWPLKLTIVFHGSIYLTYLIPLIAGVISVNAVGMTLLFQMFLIGFTIQCLMLYNYRYRTLGREYEDSKSLIEANIALEHKVDERTAELTIANNKLTELDTLKSQFFANVSHELRTPLTLAMGPVETVLSAVRGVPDVAREYLETARRNQIRLYTLINTLLDFSKLEAGKEKLVVSKLDMGQVLKGLLDGFRHNAEKRGVRFIEDIPDTPLEVYIDREKFEKVVINLLSNAFKFTGREGRIVVRLREEGRHVTLAVEDSGIGIPTDQQSRVFERFGQVDASSTRKYAGTGIGLALVKEYTELHGGSVGLESKVGVGSTFTLKFVRGRAHLGEGVVFEQEASARTHREGDSVAPESTHVALLDLRQQIEDGEDDVVDRRTHRSVSSEQPSPLAARPNPKSEKPDNESEQDHWQTSLAEANAVFIHTPPPTRPSVLIVDDTADMRAYIKSLLSQEFDVFVAKDGVEGLAQARKLSPDLILSDLMMPNMSGDELCRLIKAEPPPLGDTPVVLLTARAEEHTKIQTLNYGADDYLLKPFIAEEIRLRVRNLTLKRRQALALRAAYKTLQAKQAYIDGDLETASRFQRGLLPNDIVMPHPLRAHAIFQPADTVGGDFYNAIPLNKDTTRILVADIAGHGVKAAFRAIAAWAEYTSLDHSRLSPAEVLTTLNRISLEKYSDLSGCFLCLDLHAQDDTRVKLTYAQAGECPAVVVSNDPGRPETCITTVLARKQGFILGMFPGMTYALGESMLTKGDRLYLYTDGLEDQENAQGASYGGERLTLAWQKAHLSASIEDATQSVFADFEHFYKTEGEPVPQLDDVTILGFFL